jgi:hypothetical protein
VRWSIPQSPDHQSTEPGSGTGREHARCEERLLSSGVEPVGTTPEQYAAIIKTDIARMGKTIKDAGIRVE